jgi:hypothetical protein
MDTTDAGKIADMLGWTKRRKDGHTSMNQTAHACSNATILLREGHLALKDLKGLSVRDAREVCQHAVNRMRQIDKMAKVTGRPHAEVKKAKAQIARGARKVAKDVAAGQTLTKSIRGQADVETYRFAKQAKKQTPLFAAFADNLINQIARMVSLDSSAEKLHEIVMALPHLQMEEDLTKVRRVDFELGELVTRANEWRSKLSGAKIMKDGNVVHLKALPGGAS